MEQRLDKLPDLGFEDEPVKHVKIAMTAFAFDNAQIINLLKKRGKLIEKEDWNAMAEIDSEINKIKKEELRQVITPVSVFFTFENEEGVNRCLGYNKAVNAEFNLFKYQKWLDKYILDFKQASEPSDIIWENRHITDAERRYKKIITHVVLAFVLSLSFSMLLICSQTRI